MVVSWFDVTMVVRFREVVAAQCSETPGPICGWTKDVFNMGIMGVMGNMG